MKRIFILFVLIGFLTSCSKDDEVKCVAEDFVGTWQISGGNACILTDTNVLTISKVNDTSIQGVYSGNGVTSDFSAWTIDGCNFTGKVAEPALLLDINISGTLNGTSMTIRNRGTFFGMNVDCTENLSKQ